MSVRSGTESPSETEERRGLDSVPWCPSYTVHERRGQIQGEDEGSSLQYWAFGVFVIEKNKSQSFK